MSDTVATQDALVAPSNGQARQASEQQAQGSTSGQPSDDGQAAKERENIRKLQSTYDQKLAAQNQQLQQYQQQMRQYQQQLEQMQEQAAPDDFSRLELKLQRAEQKAAQYEAQLAAEYQAKQAANARNDALSKLADKYGIDVEDIERSKPADYDEAVEAAIAARERKRQKQQEQEEDKRERNRVDVGGGRTSTPSARWQEEYEEAIRNRDSAAQIRLLRQQGK